MTLRASCLKVLGDPKSLLNSQFLLVVGRPQTGLGGALPAERINLDNYLVVIAAQERGVGNL